MFQMRAQEHPRVKRDGLSARRLGLCQIFDLYLSRQSSAGSELQMRRAAKLSQQWFYKGD
jgi:hypothetical protein